MKLDAPRSRNRSHVRRGSGQTISGKYCRLLTPKELEFEPGRDAQDDIAKEAGRLHAEAAKTTCEIQYNEFSVDRITGVSEHIRDVRELIKKVARSEASTILIQGESGTGKDLVAHAIHYESNRRARPFFAVNCAAIPESLMESELFGHEKGAFTDARSLKKGLFEMADGGSLFLDEVSEMNFGMQAKLLRVLEGHSFRRIGGVKSISVDVRVIAATNRNLEEAVRNSRFRQDLYYRLAIIPILMLPLREHKEDIAALLDHFIHYYNQKFRKNIQWVTDEAKELVLAYHWPGNVRELKNAVERVMILAEGDSIDAKHLPIRISDGNLLSLTGSEEDNGIQLPEGGISLYNLERELIRQAMVHSRGNKSIAARLLRITRDTLRYKLKKYQLQ
jgi:two-component system, NtrC family, response regulator AtoC